MSNIDITKVYTTRKGLKVHLYEERNGYIYGRYCEPYLGQVLDCWTPASWNSYGICNQNIGTDFDLVPVKTWRAWKKGETPLYFMLRQKFTGGQCIGHASSSPVYYSNLFANYDRLHEDGTTTPCGVLE